MGTVSEKSGMDLINTWFTTKILSIPRGVNINFCNKEIVFLCGFNDSGSDCYDMTNSTRSYLKQSSSHAMNRLNLSIEERYWNLDPAMCAVCFVRHAAATLWKRRSNKFPSPSDSARTAARANYWHCENSYPFFLILLLGPHGNFLKQAFLTELNVTLVCTAPAPLPALLDWFLLFKSRIFSNCCSAFFCSTVWMATTLLLGNTPCCLLRMVSFCADRWFSKTNFDNVVVGETMTFDATHWWDCKNHWVHACIWIYTNLCRDAGLVNNTELFCWSDRVFVIETLIQ